MKTTNYYNIINSQHVHVQGLQYLVCVCLYVLGVFIPLFFVELILHIKEIDNICIFTEGAPNNQALYNS